MSFSYYRFSGGRGMVRRLFPEHLTRRAKMAVSRLRGLVLGGIAVFAVGGIVACGGGGGGGGMWTARAHGPGGQLNAVAWSGSTLVAAGDSTILTSSDGVQWTQRSAPIFTQNGVTW